MLFSNVRIIHCCIHFVLCHVGLIEKHNSTTILTNIHHWKVQITVKYPTAVYVRQKINILTKISCSNTARQNYMHEGGFWTLTNVDLNLFYAIFGLNIVIFKVINRFCNNGGHISYLMMIVRIKLRLTGIIVDLVLGIVFNSFWYSVTTQF